MENSAPIRWVDTCDCRNLKSVERTVLFALASARADGCHIVKIRHGDRRITQLRTFMHTLLRKGEIRLFVEGKNLGEEDDPGSLYLKANFEAETSADPAFWDKDGGVTVVCI